MNRHRRQALTEWFPRQLKERPMIDDRMPSANTEHQPGPADQLLDRPREGASIPVIAAILAVAIVIGGILLYNHNVPSTSTAQYTPPATTSAPSASRPLTQQPTQSNPAGTQ